MFNTGDEFQMHVFKAHLTTSILTLFGTSSTDDVQHEPTKEWLFAKSEEILNKCIAREIGADPTYSLHRLFMHHAYPKEGDASIKTSSLD